MINNELQEVVKNLFDRQWDANIDNDEEDERLQTIYDNTVAKYGWENTFESIDDYMRTKCLDGESVFNFINLFFSYNCYETRKIKNPYRFLGYIYYRMDLAPWKYDAVDLLDGIVNDLLSTPDNKSHDSFWNPDYIPEKDPDIIAEVEKLKKAEHNE